MSAKQQIDLFSVETERYALTGLAQHPILFPELDVFVRDEDFHNPTHKTIYQTLKSFLLDGKKINHVIISSKLTQLGIKKYEDDLDIGLYVQNLFTTKLPKDGVIDFFKELSGYRIRREIYQSLKDAAQIVKSPGDKSISDIVTDCERLISGAVAKSVEFTKSGPINIFESMEDVIEDLGNNPPDLTKMLYGPFETLNNLYGSLHKKSNITLFGARTGVAKTSWAMYYNVWMAEKYNLPILWMDFGEMTPFELQLRAAACLTNGLVPIYAVESGLWRNNKAYTDAIRSVWPRIKKLRLDYVDVSRMNDLQIIAYTRRYQYNEIGRGNDFIWVFDYIKPFDSDNHNTPEWKQMGHFVDNIKGFITSELPISFWSSIQLNRSGITTNKSASEVNDSEGAIGISDRINHYCSHTFIIRRKVLEEIELHGLNYGNLMGIPVKTRHLGKDAERALKPVKMPDGKYRNNFFNIEGNNFFFQDKGDLVSLAKDLECKIDLQDSTKDDGSLSDSPL